MKIKIYLSICILSFMATIQTNAQELRAEIKWEYQTAPRLQTELKLQAQNTINNYETTPSNFTTSLMQAKLNYELTDHFSFASSLKYAHNLGIQKQYESTSSESVNEGKMRLTFDMKYKMERLENDFRFSNRMRFQNSILENKKKQYLRNKIECDYKISKNLKPYFAFEPYYNLKNGEINNYRMYLGSEFKLSNNSIEIYMIYELNTKHENLKSNRIFGVSYQL